MEQGVCTFFYFFLRFITLMIFTGLYEQFFYPFSPKFFSWGLAFFYIFCISNFLKILKNQINFR
jgi:hypothetical protein